MKNRLLKIVLSGIMTLSLFGCGKSADKIANQYTVNNSGAELYADIPLTYTDGFSSKIAVVGADAVNSPGSDEITSDAALLVDVNTGEVLFQKNPHKKEYPASTTKILTSLIAIKYGDANSVRKVGDEVIINESNVVMCDFRQGDLIPFDIAIHGALMKSGNDAAAVLALFAADNMSDAVALMNKEAKSLGATESNFVNPHGLYNDNHYTTAYDLYLIFNEAIKYSKFVDTLSCMKYTGSFTRKTAYGDYSIGCSYTNSNGFLTGSYATPDGIKVYGGKAGYTEVARRSYVMLAESNNGHKYIIITMRAESNSLMYKDITALLNKIPVEKKSYADNE